MLRVLALGFVLVVLVITMVTVDAMPVVKGPASETKAAEGIPAAPIRVAIIGDSLSAGRSRFLANGLDDESWMRYANGDGIQFVGGWARFGATPTQMSEAVGAIDRVDVLVILAGTNAVRTGKTVADEVPAYERIVSVVRPRRVVISSIPPYRRHPAAALQFNQDLRRLTVAQGWIWADPWAIARDGDDWAEGFSADGTHPAGPAQYEVLGESFRRIILETRMIPSALG